MLAAVRRFTKSWIAIGILGLLIISFAVFGISDVFTGAVNQWVVKTGDRTVSSTEFRRMFDEQRRQMEQQRGPITIEDAVTNGLDQQMLAAVASQESMSAIIERAGVRISDAQVAAELRTMSALFNQVTGQFDQEIYLQRLAEQSLTPAQFERSIRDQKAAEQLVSALAFGLRAPRIATAWIGAYALEERDLSMFALDPSMVPRPAPATDAEMETFLKENAARFTRPELRTLTVVDFDPAGLGDTATIDPAEVRKRFEFRKETLGSPETRTYVQISAADAAQAAQISQRLAKGEDPAAVAKALNRPITTETARPRSAIPDAAIAQAVYGLSAGQASGPVKAQLGLVVLKLNAVTLASEPDFETERPRIEAEIRAQHAEDVIATQIEAYEAAHSSGMSLPAAAAKAGAKVRTVGPVTAQGAGENGAPVAGVTPAMLTAAFSTNVGADSDIQDVEGGGGFAVRVERSIPPLLPKAADLKPVLSELVAARKTMEAINARAEALRERIAKGETVAAVAASAGATVGTIKAMNRMRASQDPQVAQTMPQALLMRMFDAKAGEVFTVDIGAPRVLVAKLDAVRTGDRAQMAQITEAQRPQLTAQIFRDMQEQLQSQATTIMKARTNLASARNALGVDPDFAARVDGKAPAAPAAPKG